MSTFYRYLRPLEYNFKRNCVETSPRGGICFRVIDDTGPERGEKNLAYRPVSVSFSICHDNDVFSREVAKKVADHRPPYLISTNSLAANMIALALVDFYDHTLPKGQLATPLQIYQASDLRTLKDKILSIRAGHARCWELDKMDRDAIEALHLKEMYERKL